MTEHEHDGRSIGELRVDPGVGVLDTVNVFRCDACGCLFTCDDDFDPAWLEAEAKRTRQ